MVSEPVSADVSALQRQLAKQDQVIAALQTTLLSLQGQIAQRQLQNHLNDNYTSPS